MEKGTVTVRYPDYLFHFRCIGPACSDNCCHSWPIEIDKAHYLRYRAQKNAEFAALCAKYLHRIKKDATERSYARLSLDGQGRCGFQDADGGCRIIRLLGEDWLSETCCLYPRRKNEFVPDQWELSLAMSCEEVVRLGVLRQEEIRICTEVRHFDEKDPLFLLPPTGCGRKGSVTAPPAWGDTLRTVCIKLMQLRELSLQERLAALLLLMRRLDRLVAAGQEQAVLPETLRFLQSIEQGAAGEFLKALEENLPAQLTALQIAMGHILAGRTGTATEAFVSFLAPYLQGDAQTGLRAGKAAAEALLQQLHRRADPAIGEHAVWMENYFVNDMFSSMFPFGNRGNGYHFEYHALLLLQQYGILRCLLATLPGEDPRQRFTKAMVHTARLSRHGDFAGDFRALLESFRIPDGMIMLYLLKS